LGDTAANYGTAHGPQVRGRFCLVRYRSGGVRVERATARPRLTSYR
jgi:hypothetical protein